MASITDIPYKVRMLAFATEDNQPTVWRIVHIPDIYREAPVPELLNQIYHFGQNDFQPQDLPSVSMGDVIEIQQHKYLIMAIGFKQITEDEYRQYRELPRKDRSLYVMGLHCTKKK